MNVITYGTFDLFHIGHLRLLKRCKEYCGQYGKLFVVVSSDKFNWNEKHKKCIIPDYERMEIVAGCKYVDKVLLEESWEQKRRDIIDNKIDIFIMGNDWEGKFDSLKDLCQVIYLPRTENISTTDIKKKLKETWN